MFVIKRLVLILYCFIAAFSSLVEAQDFSRSACRVTVYDEIVELEDSRIAVDLARSSFEAYEKIFKMIEGLWEGNTIPRMEYIRAKYDLDAARLQLEQYSLMLERQAALVEQYRLICSVHDGGREDLEMEIWKIYLKYQRADCDALAKGVEVAETNLVFNQEYLNNILKLRSQNFATNIQVVLAELEVELEEKSLANSKRRASICRDELAEMEKNR